MAITQPYGGLSNDRLTALINIHNPGVVVQEGVDFSYGQPRDYSDESGQNTEVTLTPVAGTLYTGPTDVHYIRLPINVLDQLPTGAVKQVVIDSFPFSIHGSLDAINAALGVDLTPDEVEDATYSEEQGPYVLHVLGASSLAWLDSTYEFQVRLLSQSIPLGNVIVQPQLTGFIYVPNSA